MPELHLLRYQENAYNQITQIKILYHKPLLKLHATSILSGLRNSRPFNPESIKRERTNKSNSKAIKKGIFKFKKATFSYFFGYQVLPRYHRRGVWTQSFLLFPFVLSFFRHNGVSADLQAILQNLIGVYIAVCLRKKFRGCLAS